MRGAFEHALAEARLRGARTVETRVLRQSEGSDPAALGARADGLGEVLCALGFHHAHDRVEYRLALDADLDDRVRTRAAGDPLRWRSLAPTGDVTLAHAAAMLARVSVGDPMSSPDDDAEDFVRTSLVDPELSGDSACVQLGALDGEDVAFVMAQAHRGDGPSRITYMGVVPAHRAKGIGALVHLRGLAMLRAQHAVRYHGGTTTTNAPMRRLFEALGAAPYCTLEAWSLDLR